MTQKILTQVGAFVRETLQAINDNFTELFARPIGGPPGGLDTQVQFNNAGTFGGNENFTFKDSSGSGDWQINFNGAQASQFAGGNAINISSGQDGGGPALQLITSDSDVAATISGLYSGGTIASPTATPSGVSLLGLSGVGVDSAVAPAIAARIDFRSDGDATATNVPGRIVFSTTPPSGALAEALRIDSSQHVIFAGAAIFATHTPSAANDTGVAGQFAWDSGFIYICVATNTWKRVAIATWP